MKMGQAGHGARKRAGPTQVNTARVRLLIGDALAHSYPPSTAPSFEERTT